MKIDVTKLSVNELVLFKRGVQAILRTGEMQIVFEKLNGEITVRRGTLKPLLIEAAVPSADKKENDFQKARKENMESIRFFDLDKNAWRTLVLNNLISVGGSKPEDLIKF